MEDFSSDVKNELIKNLTGKDILSLCLVSSKLNQICTNERYKNMWKLKIQQDFGMEPTTNDYFNEYKNLYREYQNIMDYPEIYDMYKKLGISNIEEYQFVEDVLKFRDELESLISTYNDNLYLPMIIKQSFNKFCKKYNLTKEQCKKFGNIFDLHIESIGQPENGNLY